MEAILFHSEREPQILKAALSWEREHSSSNYPTKLYHSFQREPVFTAPGSPGSLSAYPRLAPTHSFPPLKPYLRKQLKTLRMRHLHDSLFFCLRLVALRAAHRRLAHYVFLVGLTFKVRTAAYLSVLTLQANLQASPSQSGALSSMNYQIIVNSG